MIHKSQTKRIPSQTSMCAISTYCRVNLFTKLLIVIDARAPLLDKRAFISNAKIAFVRLRWTTTPLFLYSWKKQIALEHSHFFYIANRARAPSALSRPHALHDLRMPSDRPWLKYTLYDVVQHCKSIEPEWIHSVRRIRTHITYACINSNDITFARVWQYMQSQSTQQPHLYNYIDHNAGKPVMHIDSRKSISTIRHACS